VNGAGVPPAASAAIERVGIGRVVAILRGDYRGREEEIVDVLAGAGVTAVEVTLNSPGAVEAIGRLARSHGPRVAVGAGTVLRPAVVESVAGAGATFVVSPNRDSRVSETTKRLGLASFPGCFTPSEIVEALAAGADAVKLFPARLLDPALVKDLRAPLGDVRFVPTGGVTPERAREFIAAGAWAVGVGSELAGPSVLEPGGLERLRERAARFAEAVRALP
jgi:Entner-Doudoroff aldolase